MKSVYDQSPTQSWNGCILEVKMSLRIEFVGQDGGPDQLGLSPFPHGAWDSSGAHMQAKVCEGLNSSMGSEVMYG